MGSPLDKISDGAGAEHLKIVTPHTPGRNASRSTMKRGQPKDTAVGHHRDGPRQLRALSHAAKDPSECDAGCRTGDREGQAAVEITLSRCRGTGLEITARHGTLGHI